MAIELAPHNIQVNAIAPGWIETDMTAPVKTMPLNDEILSRTPAGRWGHSEEIAGTAVYLASHDRVIAIRGRNVVGESSWAVATCNIWSDWRVGRLRSAQHRPE